MECINGKEKAKALKFSINICSHNVIFSIIYHVRTSKGDRKQDDDSNNNQQNK